MPRRQSNLPLPYRVFFLIIEPISALIGAYYALVLQSEYLAMTDSSSLSSSFSSDLPIPLGTSIILSQLGNLYLLFALNEALVLRSTGDLKVWRTVLFVLFIADLGHLYSVGGHGRSWVYWDVRRYSAIDWGNVPFVYLGASMRLAFLCGVGMGGDGEGKSKSG
ncbi:hypothetical protein F5Y16DRAFT_389340 [Xylariaceae sp. FL0255]|nr:hypothetical protein F5Y16DRAFT_389340 [Xylariaceae sp. FL0255]